MHPPPKNDRPTGSWRDGIFACLKHGCCHSHLCLLCCCCPRKCSHQWLQIDFLFISFLTCYVPLIAVALAQVMTRMRLTWMGNQGSVPQAAKTFRRVASIFSLFVLAILALDIASFMLFPQLSEMRDVSEINDMNFQDYYSQQNFWDNAPMGAIVLYYSKWFLQILFCLYILLVTCKTRRAVREKSDIPASCCGCDDFCCSILCGCCTTMQMMRHTANYNQHQGKCCTKTGLPHHCDNV